MNEPGSAMRRKLLSRSAAIFFIRACPAAATAAVGIAFSHKLPPALNGVYQQLRVYLAVLLAIAALGIPPLMLTHTPKAVHRWLLGLRARHVGLLTVWLGLLSSLLVMVFPNGGLFSGWLLISLFVAQAMILLVETYLIINQRFAVTAFVSVLYALIFCGLHYGIIRGSLSFEQLIGAIAILSGARMLVLIFTARKTYALETAVLQRGRMPDAIRKQWLQLGIYDVSQVAFRWVDKLIISRLVGPALFSIYFIGTTDVPFMAMLLSAAGNGLLMQMAAGESTTEERLRLVNFSGATLARIVFPVFFFLFAFRYEFIEVVFSKKYLPSVPLFAISVSALLLRAYNYTSILQHLNQVKTINWGALLDLSIALGLAYPLFLWKGLPGVAFAFMISSYIQAAFYLFKTSRLLRCSPLQLIPWKQWLVMLIVFGTVAIGLHEGLVLYFGTRQTLLLGFMGTTLVIAAAILPVVFSKKAHG